ncbi:M20/M25/M40 family metallo-hydrolase [Parasporobacterium paucivorans]|uniref:Peptidase T-like protein n=1 Tax=Parasporobacterium paucivorans DSM 15970 TaxID=1122934 RepID=A0A1M6JK38_9FIRM|nr:M20/M25/M40 family metallo-hydrolase [Parasporobacterium paucivorans]SHJ47036.1 peptidase T-like protein [Parasporobacterium paucivorans DSM 15970]
MADEIRIDSERLVKEFFKLVSLDCPSFGERRIADYLKSELADLGFEILEDKAGEIYGGSCGNIYGFLQGELAGEPILFSAHMDTVEPAIGKEAVLHPDGRITSKGSTVLGADDAAGITSILEAVRYVREKKIAHRSIEVLFTIAEEVYAKGAAVFDYRNIKAKEAYTLDLSGPVGTAAYRAPSILSYTVNIKGKASHAGFEPEKGINAVSVAAKAISDIKVGKIDTDTTVNVGVIEGGTATNIVPARCTIRGEVRSFSNEKALKVLADIAETFRSTAAGYGAGCEWIEVHNCIAFEIEKSHPVIKRYERACEERGISTVLVETFGGSDHNVYAQKGIKGIVISTAMNRVHTCDEYSDIKELVNSSEVVVNLLTI